MQDTNWLGHDASVFEVNEDAAKVLIVFFNPVIQRPDVLLIKKAQHLFLELAAALAGDNLHQPDFALYRFLYNPVEFGVDLAAFIVDIVQIKLEFRHYYASSVVGAGGASPA
jgi:hypothetical protein